MKLSDVIDKYIDKQIKIGGNCGGFIFCGYIHSNYKDLFKELNSIEDKRSLSRINHILREEQQLTDQSNKMSKKMIDGHLDKEKIDAYDKSVKEKFASMESRLKKAYDEQIIDCDLLSMELIDEYSSNIDGSNILIIDYRIHGKFIDRNEYISKDPFKSLAKKYKI